MFFGKNSTINVLSPNHINKNDPRPIAFKGTWGKDAINGDGFLKFSDGLCIYGQFNDNLLKDTVMQAIYPNGDIYAGYHKGGIKHGKGTYTYSSLDLTYKGEWV